MTLASGNTTSLLESIESRTPFITANKYDIIQKSNEKIRSPTIGNSMRSDCQVTSMDLDMQNLSALNDALKRCKIRLFRETNDQKKRFRSAIDESPPGAVQWAPSVIRSSMHIPREGSQTTGNNTLNISLEENDRCDIMPFSSRNLETSALEDKNNHLKSP